MKNTLQLRNQLQMKTLFIFTDKIYCNSLIKEASKDKALVSVVMERFSRKGQIPYRHLIQILARVSLPQLLVLKNKCKQVSYF